MWSLACLRGAALPACPCLAGTAGSGEAAAAGCPATSTSICHEPRWTCHGQTPCKQMTLCELSDVPVFFSYHDPSQIGSFNYHFPFQLAYIHSGLRNRSGAVSRFWEAHLSPRLTPLQGVSEKKPWVEILAGQWRRGWPGGFCQGSPALKPLEVLQQEALLQGKAQRARTATL